MRDHPLLATEEDLAEILLVDTDQVGRWKQRKGFEPVGSYMAQGRKAHLYSVTKAKQHLARDKKKESA